MAARGARLAVCIGVVCALVVGAASPASPAPTRPRYLFIGDSLVEESADYLRFFGAMSGAEVVVLSYGGTAICDWFAHMENAVRYWDPDAVVLAFSGNASTPCMRGPLGEPLEPHQIVERYGFHMEVAMWLLSAGGASIVWAASPPAASESAEHRGLTELLRAAPYHWSQARFVDGGARIAPGGTWAYSLPCLPFEPCTGPTVGAEVHNVVRSPDGAHFCPVDRVADAACPVHSSGAMRYALTLLESATAPPPR